MRTHDEQALLAAVINGANPYDAQRITSESFYDPRDGRVWAAMIELSGQGIRPDPASIATRQGKNADHEYLDSLIDRDVNPANIAYHAEKVAETASRRKLTDIAYQIHAAAETNENYDEVIETARAALDDAVMIRQGSRSLAEIYPDLVKSMREGKQKGYSTPWPDLDRLIVGFQPGRLYTLAARPGVGKTIAAQDIATHMSRAHRKRVYFSTLEMSDEELGLRFLSTSTGIDSKKLQTGELSSQEWQKIDNAGHSGFVDIAVDVSATSSQTIETIRSGARDTARKGDLGMIVVDYLQLMEGAGKDRNRAEVVSEFSRGLKNMASEFEVPVLALSQLNREAADNAPTLAHLRESGSIEQDSDAVIMLHEDRKINNGIVTMMVLKARNGSLGEFELTKYGHYSSLRDTSQSSPYQPYDNGGF